MERDPKLTKPHSQFLDQISDLFDWVVNTDQIIILGDFNMHVD